MNGATRKYPLDFRREEVEYVMQRWRAADSCALVGVGSVGKSNLLQHLANPDVQSHYMNISNIEQFKAIIIDPNMLGPLPKGGDDIEQKRCWAGYELMMHRLYMDFFPFNQVLEREDAEDFSNLYLNLQDGTNPLYSYMGLRYFELGISHFIRNGVRIVFMFDEFEELMKQLPTKFFHTLRGIRDANKRQLSYLTFTRKPLSVVAEELDIPYLEIEPFLELFTDSTIFVGPYNENDARQMVYSLMQRNQRPYPEHVADLLMQATGRYAGLLRAAFRLLDTFGSRLDTYNAESFAREIAHRSTIRTECVTIWKSLSEAERHVLRAVANLTSLEPSHVTEQAVSTLVQKRLIRIDKLDKRLYIEPPVFRIFITDGLDGNK